MCNDVVYQAIPRHLSPNLVCNDVVWHATQPLCVQQERLEGLCGGSQEIIWLLLFDVTAGLALQARAADDRDVAPHPLHHRPGVQSARVLLGRRGSLLAVHHVPEVEQVRRSLAEERARGRGLWTWGALHNRWSTR